MKTMYPPSCLKVRANRIVERMSLSFTSITSIEWLTLCLIISCYSAWGLITVYASILGSWLTFIFLSVVIALHSSLQHEVLHGHPTRHQILNELLIFPAIGVFIPYERFRQTHLQHHIDPNLTDPYEDPESNYLDPEVWARLSWPIKIILRFNNTLLGRMAVGPAISLFKLYSDDVNAMAKGTTSIWRAYLLHIFGLIIVLIWLSGFSTISTWLYLLVAYFSLSILKIRTFLEHRAFESVPGRIVVIEKQDIFSCIFLNNNFHAVHHAYPGVAWYKLPGLYRSQRKYILHNNANYCYTSYWEVFRKYLFYAKDPVAHPLFKTRHKH